MKHGGTKIWEAMLGVVGKVETALETVESRLPADFPVHTWNAIECGMRSQARQFLVGLDRIQRR